MAATNPFLQGNCAPVLDEVTAFDLDVEGAIPPELSGMYVRTGPNPFEMPTGPYHWFVGNGMVHGVALEGGSARWYRNRFVLTDELAAHLGVDPLPGPDTMQGRGLGNTNVVGHAGRILALTETTLPFELDRELATIAKCELGGSLPFGFTAHPKRDPDTGELHAFAYWIEEPYVLYHRVDTEGTLVQTEPIPVRGPTSMHDFMVTQQHLVWLDLPVVFDIDLVAQSRPFPFRWTPEYGARVGVMPRDGSGSDTRWFDLPELCYVFHPLNGYDDEDGVVLDVVHHPTVFASSLEGPNDPGTPTLERWTIDLAAGAVKEERLDDRGQEFPRVPDALVGRPHRYGYAVEVPKDGAFDAAGLLKHDLARGATEHHDLGEGRSAAEFVFVPSSGGTSEDDGWMMGYVYDAATDRSDFVILDAHDFTGPPAATVHLPQRVPYGFHGNWIPR